MSATCHITGEPCNDNLCYRVDTLRESLLSFIKKTHPDIRPDSFISQRALNDIRRKYLASLVESEYGELNTLEKEVLDAISNNHLLSENIEPDITENLSFGQRIADRIAQFGGSWTFIILFFSFILLWMATNIWFLTRPSFDPYPFILLNLILSCLAAIQAPIIMMSQNRQEEKDRIRSEHDYQVNLKAELEIQLLHEKMDHLMIHQNKRLLEIQEIQTDYLEEILKKIEEMKKGS